MYNIMHVHIYNVKSSYAHRTHKANQTVQIRYILYRYHKHSDYALWHTCTSGLMNTEGWENRVDFWYQSLP
jgi:hypothetical protein